jgi:DNA-binding transcriptional ArsR family regulator
MTAPALDVFQVIADPNRREMLMMLSKDNMTINGIAEHFDMSRPAVSKHIKALHLAGFISIKDIGRERYCTLSPDGFDEIQAFIRYFDKFWTSKLQKLQDILNAKSNN